MILSRSDAASLPRRLRWSAKKDLSFCCLKSCLFRHRVSLIASNAILSRMTHFLRKIIQPSCSVRERLPGIGEQLLDKRRARLLHLHIWWSHQLRWSL